METLNLSSVQPVARPMVEAVSTVYLRHVRPWLIGLMIHGSALKGGFIPACSDIDLHVYLDDAAFTAQGQLPLEVCLAIQQELAQIDPRRFNTSNATLCHRACQRIISGRCRARIRC